MNKHFLCKLDKQYSVSSEFSDSFCFRYTGWEILKPEIEISDIENIVTKKSFIIEVEHKRYLPHMLFYNFMPNDGYGNWLILHGDSSLKNQEGRFYRFINDEEKYINFTLFEVSPISHELSFLIDKRLVDEISLNSNNLTLPHSLSKSSIENPSFIGHHTGQGLFTSLKSGDNYVAHFDIGIGTPYKRDKNPYIKNYNGYLFKNIKERIIILSHWDSDHYRLASWKPILAEASWFFSLPFNVKACHIEMIRLITKKGKYRLIKNKISYSSSSLKISSMKVSGRSSNHYGLITWLKIHDKNILITGDTSYQALKNELNYPKKLLKDLNVVTVPHHGDFSSQYEVPKPSGNEPKSFFSAGDHKGYKHPTKESIRAHKALKWIEINTNKIKFMNKVIEIKLV